MVSGPRSISGRMATADGGAAFGFAGLLGGIVTALPRCISGVVTKGGEKTGATGTATPPLVAWPEGVTTACATAKVEITVKVTMNSTHRFIRGSQGACSRR